MPPGSAARCPPRWNGVDIGSMFAERSELHTVLSELNKLPPEALETSFCQPQASQNETHNAEHRPRNEIGQRWPAIDQAAPKRGSQKPGGGGESPQASSKMLCYIIISADL